MKKTTRLIGIDIFRGWAIILMVLFHLSYDLQHFDYIDFHIQNNTFFIWFRFLIVSMFLFTVGMSLKLTHQKSINYQSLKKRAILLSIASIFVTIGSYIIFPTTWIYFGVLHFVLLASFIILPFLNYPKFSIITATVTFIAFQLNILNMHWLFNLLVTPLHLPPNITEDVVRFFPWISFVLLGSATVTLNWHQRLFNTIFFNKKNKINSFFTLLGRHSLLIYIVHQPILFGLFLLLKESS
jgi:uncharacterized membrane protein